MGKVVLVTLIVVALIFWLRHKAAHRLRGNEPAAAPDQEIEAMVMCARCGVHLPGNEAVIGASGKTYCEKSHRALSRDDLP